MLGLAKRTRARILQASTSEVYGDPEVHPQQENYAGSVNIHSKRACYDEGKRCAETLYMDYHRQHGIDIRIARIFNTYGPRMQSDDGRVISNFIVGALRNEPITIYGSGEQTRSFCYISDMVQGLIKLMGSDTFLPVNLGNPSEITILEIANFIKILSGSKSEITFHALPDCDPKRRCPDISRATELLNWIPQVDLIDGMKITIDYFRSI
jgi:UDP-glucuronate decarboxylase